MSDVFAAGAENLTKGQGEARSHGFTDEFQIYTFLACL